MFLAESSRILGDRPRDKCYASQSHPQPLLVHVLEIENKLALCTAPSKHGFPMKTQLPALLALALLACSSSALAEAYRNPYGRLPTNATPGDLMFAEYFRAETRALGERSLRDIATLADWQKQKDNLRQQLFEMLSLDPLPPKTDLKATVTGKIDHPEFTVEKLQFQSRPGLYVTADVYVPKNLTRPAPAILYVCGHGPAKTNGVSYGNKVTYQHHGIWFARHGYVCLVMDTIQLGEIEGIHHGTHREKMWWWNSRGYSSAGAEAWNCIRALDYLETRGDVDPKRMGVTGRSGGGAYSWWVAALDERIAAACPVAGITDLQNHVVDGCVEGHCDCMFMVNTYRWDYAQIAALVAPRPMLIVNTDKDTIFPLDGVGRVHERVRRIYDLHNSPEKLGLVIAEGPHGDMQDIQLPVLRWFNKWLKKETPPIQIAPAKLFSGQELKVFGTLPADEITSTCYENFTQLAKDGVPTDSKMILAALRAKTFGGWPDAPVPLATRQLASADFEGVNLSIHEFESQNGIRLRMYLQRPQAGKPQALHIKAIDATDWPLRMELARAGFVSILGDELRLVGIDPTEPVADVTRQHFSKWMRSIAESNAAHVMFAPRGVGVTALGGDARYQTHVRRRCMLLGQTMAGMQVWDLLRAVEAARSIDGLGGIPLHLHGTTEMTEVTAFASLFAPSVARVQLPQPPRTDKEAPDFLNWSRIVTPGQLLALVRDRCSVSIVADGIPGLK